MTVKLKGVERDTIELQQKNNCAIHVVANGFGEQLLGPTSREAKLFMNKVNLWVGGCDVSLYYCT